MKLTKNIPHVTRGSCGSSLVCYLLGISHIDPVKYNVKFARFLNEFINNLPDILLKNLAENLGLSGVPLFDEKSLDDILYSRLDSSYGGISNGYNIIEAEYEFYRRLLVNLAHLYKAKGTRSAIEFFLKFNQ